MNKSVQHNSVLFITRDSPRASKIMKLKRLSLVAYDRNNMYAFLFPADKILITSAPVSSWIRGIETQTALIGRNQSRD